MLERFERSLPRDCFNNVNTVSAVIAQEGVALWHCVKVFVEELQDRVFKVFRQGLIVKETSAACLQEYTESLHDKVDDGCVLDRQ